MVCDDNSSDDTRAVLATVGDPRLRVFANRINQGPGTDRDRAIAATAAPWLAVIDVDHKWDPRRIEVLMAAREDVSGVMVCADLMQFRYATDVLIPRHRLRSGWMDGSSAAQRVRPVAR